MKDKHFSHSYPKNLKVSIVTPNLNGGKYLEETIKSVINQDYKNIEYIIVDGNSSDNSHEIINRYKKKIQKVIISKDQNMYEAIHKGFLSSTGHVLLWINSDDYLINNSISKIVDYFYKTNCNWINGISTFRKGSFSISNFIPYFYPKEFIQKGRCHKSSYGFIPQESVAFSRNLYFLTGGLDTKLKFAGDYFLWKIFSKYENLIPVNFKIGVFRKREGQLSSDMASYYKEINKNFSKSFNIRRMLYSILFFLRLIRIK